jgi:hypothetical protein
MSDVQTDPQVPEADASLENATPETPETKPDHSWVPKRISEITAARRAAEARAEQAEAEVARLRSGQSETPPVPHQPTQDVDQLARAYAERMVREQRDQDTFSSRIAAINEAGAKEFGEDFDKSVQNLNTAGVGGPDFLKVLSNVPSAEKVVTWLGKPENIGEAIRITSMDPVQMGIEMTKLSAKAAKALGKQVSKAPPPPQAIDGGSSSTDGTMPDPQKDPKGFIEWRNKTARKRR